MSLYNALFGRNPASRLLLAMLNLTEGDVGRFRDCYLKRDEETKELCIVVYTRNGGGNRDDYEAVTEALQAHPAYLSDADDDFDCTYASYFFKVPEAFKATAEELAGLGADRVNALATDTTSDGNDIVLTQVPRPGTVLIVK